MKVKIEMNGEIIGYANAMKIKYDRYELFGLRVPADNAKELERVIKGERLRCKFNIYDKTDKGDITYKKIATKNNMRCVGWLMKPDLSTGYVFQQCK